MSDMLDHSNAPRRFTVIEGPPAEAARPARHRGHWDFRPTGETRHFGKFTVHLSDRVWVRADGTVRGEPVSYRCANCDTRFQATRPAPYCGLACKDQAKTVRAFRAAFATYGRATLPEDVEQALRIKMAHALAGGYDAAARYLSRAAREQIIERDGGQCVLCHSPGTEIDHIEGPSSDPANLRLLCHSCHAGITLSHCRHAPDRTDAEVDALFDEITSRIDSPDPARACDAANWAAIWRSWTLVHAQA